jgi:hypothetical protein
MNHYFPAGPKANQNFYTTMNSVMNLAACDHGILRRSVAAKKDNFKLNVY